MGTLLSGLGDKVGERFVDRLLSPALAFWVGGLLAWVSGHGGLTGERSGWSKLPRSWQVAGGAAVGDAAAQVVSAAGLLLLVAGSARLADEFTLPVLRLLEGYWPAWAEPARAWRVRSRSRRLDAAAERWRSLYLRRDSLSDAEGRALARLNANRALSPADAENRMPTALGDLLKAIETRPRNRYGLDAVVCFPRLWLVLPSLAREDLQTTRRAVDEAARIWLWSLLFVIWTPLAWWALPVAVGGVVLARRTALLRAASFGDIVQACFDVHRQKLYIALGFERPTNPEDERRAGHELTSWLERGRPPATLVATLPGAAAPEDEDEDEDEDEEDA